MRPADCERRLDAVRADVALEPRGRDAKTRGRLDGRPVQHHLEYALPQQLSRRGRPHDAAAQQDRHASRQPLHSREIVRRQQHRYAVLGQPRQPVAQRPAHHRIDPGQRLIQQQHAPSPQRGLCQSQALRLAAGQRRRAPLGHLCQLAQG
jgi:hypothetical protein